MESQKNPDVLEDQVGVIKNTPSDTTVQPFDLRVSYTCWLKICGG